MRRPATAYRQCGQRTFHPQHLPRIAADFDDDPKVASGKFNAISGEPWRDSLNHDPQDYLVLPTQPWLDGYCVEEGIIRQFVAMPYGEGNTVEEQLTGAAEHGSLQIVAYECHQF